MDKKLKIAIIGSRGYPYVYSGYETLVKELSERLVKKGYGVRVYCHNQLFDKKPKHVNGVELIYTPSVETKILSQVVNSFFSFMHVCFSNIDVILVVNSANGPFGILTKIFRKKTFINVDGLEWLRPKWKGLGSLYFNFSSRLSTIFFDKVITDSFAMRDEYLRKFKKESTVIAYGSTMVKDLNKNLIAQYDLDFKNYYLIVGRLVPDNNSLTIIKGYLNSNSTKKLVVVGDVPYQDKYADKVKNIRNKKLVFTGYINDQETLNQLYNNCYAYVHGHEFGGTNPTMINAIYCDCSIISLNTIFNREMLLNIKAIFFEKNQESITSAINKSEKLLNHDIGTNFKNKIYDWEYITNQYLDIFKMKFKK